MSIRFDKNGNLRETKTLTYGEFEKLFGFNEPRKEKIKRALPFFKILSSLGCTNIYIAGSFVSNKISPNDIDICVDTTGVNFRMLLKSYPEFLETQGIKRIQKNIMSTSHYFLTVDPWTY
jgi:hypothetical protein